MAITNYTTLKSTVAEWLDRTDLTTEIETFVDLAIERLNHALADVEMEARSSSTFDGEWNALPTDYGGIRSIRETTDGYPLTYVTPDELQRRKARGEVPDPPFYTIEDMQVRVLPAATSTATLPVEIVYLQRLSSLSAGGDTNWVIEQAPSLMLAAVLTEAYSYMKDESRATFWNDRASQMVSELVASSRRRRYPSGGLVITTDGAGY